MSDMILYRGTKTLFAKPMLRGEYCVYRGWTIPDDENPDDTGYLVEYTDGGKANHPDHKGYISWSPTKVFEQAYYPLDTIGATATQPDDAWLEQNARREVLSYAANIHNGTGADASIVLRNAEQYRLWMIQTGEHTSSIPA